MKLRAFLGASVAALLSTAAVQAADLFVPTTPAPMPEVGAPGFDWNGGYVGVRAGASFTNFGPSTTYGVVGAVAGVNFVVADPILLGVEGSADYVWNNALRSGDFFANARVGAILADPVLVYALAGAGVTVNDPGTTVGRYQIGGGVEFAITNNVTLRGEVVGQQDFNRAAGAPFFGETKATVGASFHF